MANSFTVNTYSPKDVILTIGGYQLTGWQSINVTRSVKGMVPIRGIRGKNTRVKSTDSSATILFSLIQTSQSNDVLSAIHERDLLESTGRLTLLLKDNSGRSIFSTNEGYITGYPVSTFSGGFEYRAWEIFCQTTNDYIIGGNARPTSNLIDSALDRAGNFINNLF